MAADLASLAIRITSDDAVTAKSRLDALTTSGAQAETATGKLGLSAAQVTKQLQAMGVSSDKISQILAQNGLASEAVAVAQTRAATATGIHGLQLGRLNSQLGSFVGRALGASSVAGRLGAQIGGAVFGYEEMIAALLAIGAVEYISEKLAGDTKKLAEEQDKAAESLVKWNRERQAGGSFALELEDARKKLVDINAELAKPITQGTVGGFLLGGVASVMGMGPFPGMPSLGAAVQIGVANAGTIGQQGTLQAAIDAAKVDRQMKAYELVIKEKGARDEVVQRAKDELELSKLMGLEQEKRRIELDTQAKIRANDLEAELRLMDQGQTETQNQIVAIIRARDEMDASLKVANDLKIQAAETTAAKKEQRDVERQIAEYNKTITQIGKQIGVDVTDLLTRGENAPKASGFQSFVEDVQRLSQRMSDQLISDIERYQEQWRKANEANEKDIAATIQQEINDMSALQGKAAQAGQIAGLLLQSYSVGNIIGSLTSNHGRSEAGGALGGAASGAATGAIIGSAVPVLGTTIGAIVGGATGLIGGFLGAKTAASETADALRRMHDAMDKNAASLADWRASITQTRQDQYAAAMLDLKVKYEAYVQQIEETEGGRKMEAQRNADLATAAQLYQQDADAIKNNTIGLEVMAGAINEVFGYKIAEQTYNYTPGYPVSSTPGNAPGSRPGKPNTGPTSDGRATKAVIVNLVVDGKTLATTTVQNLQKMAQAQFGSSNDWASVVV